MRIFAFCFCKSVARYISFCYRYHCKVQCLQDRDSGSSSDSDDDDRYQRRRDDSSDSDDDDDDKDRVDDKRDKDRVEEALEKPIPVAVQEIPKPLAPPGPPPGAPSGLPQIQVPPGMYLQTHYKELNECFTVGHSLNVYFNILAKQN